MRRSESGELSLRVGILVSLVFGGSIGAAAPATAQLETISEAVEVRVVNVDVVATDARGTIIRGLAREDFELTVDGREVAIEYFSAVSAPPPGSAGTDSETSAAAMSEGLPLLVIDYDARFARPGAARGAFGELRSKLDDLLASTRAIMVARQGMSLVIEQPFTRDRELLDAALARLSEMLVPARSIADRKLLTSRLERVGEASLLSLTADDEGLLDMAQVFLTEVRLQSEQERAVHRAAVSQLEALIASVSGLPGRKAVLYLGPGVQPQPAEALYRLWWSKFEAFADELNIVSVESAMGLDIVTRDVAGILAKANEGQVAFYGLDPRGVRVQSSVEFESIEASELTERDVQAAQQWVLALARGSGGAGRVNSADLAGLIDEMNDGFRNYYSLGFTPAEDFPDEGKVRVKLAHHDGRVRHFDRYVTRSGSRELGELTLAALLTEMAVNPMEIQVEMEEPERQPDGTYLVPLLVKIPIASLTLVPEGSQHVGRLSVVVQAQSAGGEISEPAEALVPIALDNESLLTSLAGMAGYRLRMRVSEGEQRIAIGVRDEVAQRDSALRMVIRTGRGS